MNVVNPVSAGIRITPSAQHHARCHLNSQWLAAEPHSAASSTLSSGSGRYLSISLVGAALCATAKWADQCRIWVNRVGWAVLACRLRPRLRTYRCEAANRRFGPTRDSCTAQKKPAFSRLHLRGEFIMSRMNSKRRRRSKAVPIFGG